MHFIHLFILYFFTDRNEHHEADFPSSYYEWRTLYKIFVKKHGGIINMQNYVLKRCLRNRQALEEHYQLSLHSSRQQKWYQYLEDREMGNHKALKALTEHMRPTTHNYMLHQVWLETTNYSLLLKVAIQICIWAFKSVLWNCHTLWKY